MDGILLDMRKVVMRRMKEIEAKKIEGFGRLEALEVRRCSGELPTVPTVVPIALLACCLFPGRLSLTP